MGRLVIHTGPHKTASTYLQANFHVCRRALRRAGWLYAIPTGAEPAHHALAQAKADQDATIIGRLWRRARRRDLSLLLSSEAFSAWPAGRFAALRQSLGVIEIELVHVLRDPLDRLVSYWAEEVKQGRCDSLPERLARELAVPQRSPLLNPLPGLRRWAREPGLRLHLVPYDALIGRGADLFAHVTDKVLGVGGLTGAAPPSNRRLPLELTEFLRLMTLSTGQSGPGLRLAFMAATTPHERTRIVDLVAREAASAKRQLHLPDLPPFVHHIDARLRNEFGGCLTDDPGSALFSRRTRRIDYYADAGLWKSEALRNTAQGYLERLAA